MNGEIFYQYLLFTKHYIKHENRKKGNISMTKTF